MLRDFESSKMSLRDELVYPEQVNFHVLSPIISAAPDGYYPFAERIHLSFLEPIRRDLFRYTIFDV